MYTYQTKEHTLLQDGKVISTDGWAGQGIGLNNPEACTAHNIGPLPPGQYTIGPAYHHPKLGPLTMDLIPAPSNIMYGRADFRIHGASKDDSAHSSEGCMIQRHEIRQSISTGLDRTLLVV